MRLSGWLLLARVRQDSRTKRLLRLLLQLLFARLLLASVCRHTWAERQPLGGGEHRNLLGWGEHYNLVDFGSHCSGPIDRSCRLWCSCLRLVGTWLLHNRPCRLRQ
jgi:hypothetical protein